MNDGPMGWYELLVVIAPAGILIAVLLEAVMPAAAAGAAGAAWSAVGVMVRP